MSAQTDPSDGDRRAADRAARLAAQTVFGAPMVLTAGAGTGKTTVLVARVLAWCLGPGWERAELALVAPGAARPTPRQVAERTLERVVAITFTEAAAAEMEKRAMTALANVVAGEAVCGYDVPREQAVAQLERSRARALLAAFDHLHVQTIHAFCRRMLANHPLDAGLHPAFEVDARGEARGAVAREVIEARLRAAGEDGDPDLEELLIHDYGAPELEEMLDALLAAAVPAGAFGADPIARERVTEFVARLREASGALATAIGERFERLAANSTGKAVARAARATRARLTQPVETREEFAALLEDLRGEWDDSPLKRLADWSRGVWNEREGRAADDAVASIAAAARALHPPLRHALDVDAALLALVHRVLAPLLATAEERLHALGAESFDALLRRTRDMLRTRPHVAERVRAEIDQLLVDEFQDTDAMQCEIVASLALGGEAAVRPGLFLVGDPKQSVYGWRNADIGAYMAFVARVREEPGAVEHALCVNHRSVPAVLGEVERVVAPAMQFESGVQPGFERLLPCDARAGIAGSGAPDLAAVEYWVSSAWDRTKHGVAAKTPAQDAARIEARHLVTDLLRLRQRSVAWKDVGLLFRSSTDLDEYLAALRDAGIPYTVDRDRNYYRRREVIEAAALVRTVLDPSDQIAQVAVLRSAWVGVPDVAWRALWTRKFPDALRAALDAQAGARDRLRAIVEDAARATQNGDDIPGLAELAGWETSALHALDVIVALRRSWLAEPVDRFVEKLRVLPLLEATEAARYPGSFRLANLARFFRELLASLEAGDAASVLRSLRRDASGDVEFYEGRPQDATLDAVQVMTIHGAKGLDFEHVYVLQLHKESGTRASAPLLLAEFDGRLEWRLAADRRKPIASLGYDRVRSRREAVEAAELVRTLYVALTRAKSRLVLAGCFGPRARSDTHAGLVVAARGAELAGAIARIGDAVRARAGAAEAAEIEGARAVLLDALPPAPPRSHEEDARSVVSDDRVRADAKRLRAVQSAAALRELRPFAARASQHVPDADREDRASASEGDGERTLRRQPDSSSMDVAAAVGTAIHIVLERFDWSAEPKSEWGRQRARVRARLAEQLPSSRVAVAFDRADALLDELQAGSLWPRLRELAPHVLARELPILVPADAEGAGAVGYGVGAIDLVYRDPASGEIAVVDFKTDRLKTRRDIAERAEQHRAQAAVYRCAVRETLRLPRAPRFELWFLDASHVEVLEFERAPGEAGLERAGSSEG